MKIAVIGCGRWGTFLAWYLNSLGHGVTLCARRGSARLERLRRERTNGLITLDKSVALSDDIAGACKSAQTVAISINAQSLRALMTSHGGALEGKTVVLCMKGLEKETGLILSRVAEEYAPGADIAVWLGPGHVQNFMANIPNCMVIDSNSPEVKDRLIRAFSSDLIRFYYGADMIGNQVGAASKNVIGIAAGMLDGLGMSCLKGALMARGTREIAHLIGAMGGNEISAYGLCHLGDYEATVFSEYSHNRKYGECFIRGEAYGELAEGVDTTVSLIKLSREYNADLPICRAVNGVLNQGLKPKEVLFSLFLRSLKQEF